MSNLDELLKELRSDNINFTIELLSDPKQSFTFRPIKTKDQKVVVVDKAENEDVQNFELKNFTSIIKLVDKLLIKSPVPFGQITVPDFIWLLINIRAKSIGESIDLVAPCHKCKTKMDLHIDLYKDIKKIEPKKDINKLVKLSNNIVLHLGMIDVEDLHRLMSLPKDDKNILSMASLIKKVEYQGEILDITMDAKIEIIGELHKEQIDKINSFADESAYGVKLEKEYVCPKCSNKGKFIFDSHEIISFF